MTESYRRCPHCPAAVPARGDRPRHYVDRQGRAFAWVNSLGRYVAID